MEHTTRRQFLHTALAAPLLLPSISISSTQRPSVAVAKHAEPQHLVRKAVELLGGMKTFVRPGQRVLIKPNIGWDRLPQQAATTNPELVAQVVRMCKEAGASTIRVLDRPCNQAQRCYKRSGIEDAAKAAGAEVRHVIPPLFKDVSIPDGVALSSWPIYKDALDMDVLINIPIAKTHSVCKVTLGMKNLMGLLGGNRGELHQQFDVKLSDIHTVLRPTLTIIDAYRLLLHNGPSGGSLEDVVQKETVIASASTVAADAFACTLFDLLPENLGFLQQAYSRGLGEIDLEKIDLKEFDFTA